jgi:hypothetical protein
MFYYCDGTINEPWCITRLRAHERVGNIHVLYRRNIVGGTLAELKWSSPMSHLWALSYPMCSITVYWPNYFVLNGLSSLMLQAYMTPKSKHHERIPYEQGWNNHSCRTGNTKNKISWSCNSMYKLNVNTRLLWGGVSEFGHKRKSYAHVISIL